MKVRFASICDQCAARSPEYVSWWACTKCGDEVCDSCIVSDSDDPETGKAECKRCSAKKEPARPTATEDRIAAIRSNVADYGPVCHCGEVQSKHSGYEGHVFTEMSTPEADIVYLLTALAAAGERNEALEAERDEAVRALIVIHEDAQRVLKSANTPSQNMWLTVQHATGAAARIVGRIAAIPAASAALAATGQEE